MSGKEKQPIRILSNIIKPDGGKARAVLQFSKDDILAALEMNHGIVTYAANSLGCSRKRLQEIVNDDKELKACSELWKTLLKDMALHGLLSQLHEENPAMIKFTLETLAKDDGFTTRTELTGKDGEGIEVNVDANLEKLQMLIDRKVKEIAEGRD